MHGLRMWGLALSLLVGIAHAEPVIPQENTRQGILLNEVPTRVEAFTSWLTNAADFTSSSSSSHLKLKYTNVRQNSALDVFELQTDGSLRILKAGVVSLSASYDAIPTSGARYVEMMILINGAIVAQSVGANTGDWTQVATHINWKVEPNDTLTLLARPSGIASMDNGSWSVLTVKWTSR
ncbi:MAG TPA: hypothetical protein VFZ09_03845 [Archangium sp.]|uniref:hypothetical protein n=1 Tax=Archangium sp. TaxID=1872627 RepID=UPI002E2EEBC1|nr:hypothetical protein [Archangium sp.]HEX5745351.1 hypothetical protein [Archangium sp.]